jgi:DNA-binding CsgD family transcriptional regulator
MENAFRHREILGSFERLVRQDLDGDTLMAGAAGLLARAFPHDLLICASLDPDTNALRRFHGNGKAPPFTGRVYINEYLEDDFNKFADLVKSPSGVGILDEATGHQKEISVRYRELYRKSLGMEHEMRGAIRLGKKLSGIVSLLRPEVKTGYDAGEARFLSAVLSGLEPALRRAWLRSLSGPGAPASVGQIFLDQSLKIEAANRAGERWRAELGSDWEPLVQSLASLVRMRGPDPEGPAGPFSPRVRMTTQQGRWVTVHGSLLNGPGGHEKIALIIEGAGPGHLQTLLWEAYGLTDREQDVFRCVLQGADTRDIAAELGISPYTVQDFFKSIFEKTGVRSRRDLVAKFLPGLGGELN